MPGGDFDVLKPDRETWSMSLHFGMFRVPHATCDNTSGEVEYGSAFDTHQGEGIFLEFSVQCGDHWWDVTKQAQQTQTAYPDEENCVVWNHPLDLHFATATVADWPRMNFQVGSRN